MELLSVPVPDVSVIAVKFEEDAMDSVSSFCVFLLEEEEHNNGVLLDAFPDGVALESLDFFSVFLFLL